MSSRRSAPEPWATAMRNRNLVHNDVPSMQALSRAAGLSVETVRHAVYGDRSIEVETQEALAQALHLDPRIIAEWVGAARSERGPWVPPAESSLLSSRQRKALDLLIRAMTESESPDGAPIAKPGQSLQATQLEHGVREFSGRRHGRKQAPAEPDPVVDVRTSATPKGRKKSDK